jgi:hypothetical protein
MSKHDAERELLDTGRGVLRKLERLSGGDPDKLASEIKAMVEAGEGPALGAAVYAALVDHVEPARSHDGAVLGAAAVAGTAGLSSDLYRAARLSRDVHAVERSVETGDPSYVVRRTKNVVLGRLLSRAGVWRRLWR